MSIGKFLTGVTDYLGLTDSGANTRAKNTLSNELSAASSNLNETLSPLYSQYLSAMNGRSLSDTLDTYDNALTNISAELGSTYGNTQSEADKALTDTNIQSYMNPYAQQKANSAAQAVAGNAGGRLQSSAAVSDMYNAAADSYANDYNTAAQQAQQNYANQYSSNNQAMQGLNTQAGLAGTQYDADTTPFNLYQNLLASMANNQYQTDATSAYTNANYAGTNNSWLNSIMTPAMSSLISGVASA